MANKRNKSKLTSKQATRISLLITLTYVIYTIICGICFKPTGEEIIYYFFVNFLIGSCFIFFIFYCIIFKVPNKESDERRKKAEIRNIQRLSSTNFTQVYFDPEDTGGNIDIMMTILKKEGCIFYAKLTENNCIHLLVKDKHAEEVFNEKIDNHLFFYNNFELQEWP